MAKAEVKTKVTAVTADEFIAAVPDARRRTEAQTLDAMLRRITGHEPAMWGPSIVGYGRYRYRYDSGREGEMCRAGFSPRKAAMTLYLNVSHAEDQPEADALFDQLGPHSRGKSCLYIKRLDAVDLTVLEALMQLDWALTARRYPDEG